MNDKRRRKKLPSVGLLTHRHSVTPKLIVKELPITITRRLYV